MQGVRDRPIKKKRFMLKCIDYKRAISCMYNWYQNNKIILWIVQPLYV